MASHFGRVFRDIGLFAALALAYVLTATGLHAAPYAAFMIDARSGEVFYSENADTRLHPASLTKMMTLYIAFQEIERGNLVRYCDVAPAPFGIGRTLGKITLKVIGQHSMRPIIADQAQLLKPEIVYQR